MSIARSTRLQGGSVSLGSTYCSRVCRPTKSRRSTRPNDFPGSDPHQYAHRLRVRGSRCARCAEGRAAANRRGVSVAQATVLAGELGQEKWEIVPKFAAAAVGLGPRARSVVRGTRSNDGSAWREFVCSCKTMLGTESGASVFDFTGEIQRSVEKYMAAHPQASFDEVSARFLRPHEESVRLNQISPRCFEAGSVAYGNGALRRGLLRNPPAVAPFIPLRKDFENRDPTCWAIETPRGCSAWSIVPTMRLPSIRSTRIGPSSNGSTWWSRQSCAVAARIMVTARPICRASGCPCASPLARPGSASLTGRCTRSSARTAYWFRQRCASDCDRSCASSFSRAQLGKGRVISCARLNDRSTLTDWLSTKDRSGSIASYIDTYDLLAEHNLDNATLAIATSNIWPDGSCLSSMFVRRTSATSAPGAAISSWRP